MSDFIPLRDVYKQWLEDRAAAVEPDLHTMGPVLTGYVEMDNLLGGLQRSDLIILGSRPATGKSALALNIAVNAATAGSIVGMFSLEMSRDQLALRILSADAQIDFHRLQIGLYTEAEEQRIFDSIGRLPDLPLFIDDSPFQSLVEMHSKAKRLELDLLVIDHLQLIQGRSHNGANREQEISEICRSTKVMARDLNVATVTCSQLSCVVENRPGHRPQLSDLRDSGSIEEDSDVVMFIHRENLYYTEEEWEQHFPGRQYPRNIAEITVAKHRNGPTGSLRLFFRDNLARFDNYHDC